MRGGGGGYAHCLRRINTTSTYRVCTLSPCCVLLAVDYRLDVYRMKASGSADDEPEMVVVGSVNRAVFLNGVNEVKTSAR